MPSTCRGASSFVQGPELAQVGQAGPVAGGEDDRIDRLALATAPDHLPSVERGEHRTAVDTALSEGLLEPDAVGHHAAAVILRNQIARQGVEPGLAEPVMHVVAAHRWGMNRKGCGWRS